MAQESIKSLQNDLKLKNETAIEQTTKVPVSYTVIEVLTMVAQVVSMEREIIAHESAYKDLLQRKESIELELKQQVCICLLIYAYFSSSLSIDRE